MSPSENQELVPTLTPELVERDPGLVEMVRALVSLELRLAERPRAKVEVPEDEREEWERVEAELERTERSLQRYAEELAISRKVDNYAWLLAYLEDQRDLLGKETKRLQTRKHAAESTIRRMEAAVHYALSLLPQPLYGPRELRGNTASLVLYQNPGHVEVINLELVPPEWIEVTVTMNKRYWLELLHAAPTWLREKLPQMGAVVKEQSVRKNELRPLLKNGAHVEGVEWQANFRVARK
jgi:hypothetical protein